jgi:2-dehydropantoate 2-reductase
MVVSPLILAIRRQVAIDLAQTIGEAKQTVKIIVMGAGALGSILAALLHEAGHEVALVARGARAEHLRANGVTIEGLANVSAQCPIVTDTSMLSDCDLLIMTVKTFDMEAALQQLAHVKVKAAISVQNGMMKEDQMAAVFGPDAVLISTSNFSGGVRDDGVALFTVNLGVTIGKFGGGLSPQVQEVCEALESAGIKAIPAADTASAAWSKLVMWCGSAIACALTRVPTGKVLTDPDGAMLAARVIREVGAVAAAEGATVEEMNPYDLPAMMLAADDEAAAKFVQVAGAVFLENMPQHKPSILQALEAGKQLEIGATLADVIARAAKHGIPVPATDSGYRLLASIDRALRTGV